MAMVGPTGVIAAVPPPSLAMVMEWRIATGPSSPPSATSISPPAVVCEYVCCSVLHGAVRVHGLESSPKPGPIDLRASGARRENSAKNDRDEAYLRHDMIPAFSRQFASDGQET